MKKPVKFVTMPISVATMPQAIVSVGSHIRGVVLFKMMLQGT